MGDYEMIVEWGKTKGGTVRDIRMQLPGLKAKSLRQITEVCERLVAEGRLGKAMVPVRNGRYIGRSLEKWSRYIQAE
jgi:hypothetical protein